MKHKTKLTSAFLAVLLLLCMSVTAFAANDTTIMTLNIPCTVSMQIGEHGKVTMDSTDYIGNSSFQKAVGEAVSYTFKPDTLYAIDKVIYNGTDVTAELSGSTYTAPALDGNKTLQVSFRFLGIGEDETYTVTFHANGHGTAPAAQTIIEGNTATEPTAPTASGWTFGGWYKDAACTEAQKYLFSATVTSDLDLYAKWTKNSSGDDPGTPDPVTYGISVINGKATIGMGSAITEAEAGQVITITANAPASGKVFDEWVITSDTKPALAKDTDAVTTFTMPAGSVTLEATYKDAPVNPGDNDDDTPTQPGEQNPETGAPGQTDRPVDQNTPQTGDNSNTVLWLALAIVSLGMMFGIGVYGRKYRYSSKHSK